MSRTTFMIDDPAFGPIPPDCEVLQWRAGDNDKVSASVVINAGGNILVSDTSFCATLSVLGIDALSDRPRSCGERMWWAFDVKDSLKIRQIASAFYQKWEPPMIDLAFVRLAIHRKKALAQECKNKALNDHALSPMTLRKLDAKSAGGAK